MNCQRCQCLTNGRFELPQDVVGLRARVANFIDTIVLPTEPQIGTRPFFGIVADVQAKARAEGLWCPFVPVEYGGMGLGHLENAIVQVEVGRSFTHLGAWALNCMGPQDATMLTLIEHGTEEQKQRYLVPLVNGDIRVCFAMTEKAAGADATGMQTTAVRNGSNWILNGEKWFTSGASISQLALVMAMTDPDAPRHQRYRLSSSSFRSGLRDSPQRPGSQRGHRTALRRRGPDGPRRGAYPRSRRR